MAMIFMQMHLHFLFNDGIIHKNAAACNRKSCKTPEKAVFFVEDCQAHCEKSMKKYLWLIHEVCDFLFKKLLGGMPI